MSSEGKVNLSSALFAAILLTALLLGALGCEACSNDEVPRNPSFYEPLDSDHFEEMSVPLFCAPERDCGDMCARDGGEEERMRSLPDLSYDSLDFAHHCGFTGCTLEQYCAPSGACQDEVFGSGQWTTSQSLGRFALSPGRARRLTFTILDTALSFALTVEAVGQPKAELSITELTDPFGEPLLAQDLPPASARRMRYSAFNTEIESLIYPNAPSLHAFEGAYSVAIATDRDVEVNVTVHIKRGPAPRRGRLPLTFWFAHNPHFDAGTAKEDPEFQAAVAELERIYAAAEIEIAPIDYRDVAEPAATFYAVPMLDIDSRSEVVAAMLNQAPPDGFHVILVDQFIYRGGNILYGTTTTLPGPVGVNRSTPRGVMVALDLHLDEEQGAFDSAHLGRTIAHELGHYMGLFHISEASGLTHDPLDDTPQCVDRNGSGAVTALECSEQGASNLMYWSTEEGFDHDRLSPAQAWVLLRNPGVLH